MKPGTLSACIEMLFTDVTASPEDRIRAAAAAGFTLVEMWRWQNKNLGALKDALEETGVTLVSMMVEPQLPLTAPISAAEIESAVRASAVAARHLGALRLITVSGDTRPSIPRDQQHQNLIENLKVAARVAEQEEITLVLEPLNTRIDHVGHFLDTTRGGLDVVKAVDSPALRLLYDFYHSMVMGEDTIEVIGSDVALVGHVHVADAPGRHEPGTGASDLSNRVRWLMSQGYAGAIGLEYWPTISTAETLGATRAMLAVR